MRIEFAHCSDVGMERSENQDAFYQGSCALGELFVVCDGMGGHRGGSIASRLAVETIGSFFDKETDANADPSSVLRAAIEAANAAVYQRSNEVPNLEGMGTTCVAMIVQPDGKQARIAHVGDSRIYRIRADRVEQLTRDHTVVQSMIDRGVLTQEQAAHHPDSNVINRSVGVRPTVEVDVREAPLDTMNQDLYLLCSDGLTGMMDDEDIYRYLSDMPLNKVTQELIDLANARGGYDNITAIVVQIGEARVPAGLSESGMARLSDLLTESQRFKAPRAKDEEQASSHSQAKRSLSTNSAILIGAALITILAIIIALAGL